MKLSMIAVPLLVLGCTTAATTPAAQTAQPAATTSAAATPAAATASTHKNLQVLPRDIPHDELIAIMRNFSRSLGVRCDACHVVTATEPKQVLDFPSDAKEEKRVARVMVQMTQQLNGTWMQRVEQAEGHADAPEGTEQRVSCWTCHRGRTDPEVALPPPPAQPGS
jgi:hypothetical protein